MQVADASGALPEGGLSPRETIELDYPGLAKAAYGAANHVLRNHADAEDVAIHALSILLVQSSTPESPRAWVTTVAKRLAINLARKLTRERDLAQRLDPVASRDVIEKLATKILVAQALERLSPQQREAIRQRYLRGEDVSTVAEMLGISRETAKTHLQRARTQLRALLADVGEGRGDV
jgi:RNA polymerase sigma-70 factor (ECF subfamily)